MNTLTALKRSTLGLDLYLWLTCRTFALPLRYGSLGSSCKGIGRSVGFCTLRP